MEPVRAKTKQERRQQQNPGFYCSRADASSTPVPGEAGASSLADPAPHLSATSPEPKLAELSADPFVEKIRCAALDAGRPSSAAVLALFSGVQHVLQGIVLVMNAVRAKC